MARDPIESIHRASQATLIALVFLVLMLVCAMASSGFAVVFRNRAQAAARAARAQQATRAARRTTR
jgi:Na+-transporting NADH:ubiquinone oxidoreductase subunit NqrC